MLQRHKSRVQDNAPGELPEGTVVIGQLLANTPLVVSQGYTSEFRTRCIRASLHPAKWVARRPALDENEAFEENIT